MNGQEETGQTLPANGTGLTRLKKAAICSWKGLQMAAQETAFRQEVFLTLVLTPLACFLGQSGVERALLIGSLLVVLLVEIINTAIEAVVDRVSLDYHPLSGMAKDMGSAAVTVALAHVVITWGCILFT